MGKQGRLKTAVYAPPLHPDLPLWRSELAEIERAGFTAVTVSDHFSYGAMDPIAALAALAGTTSRLRLMSLLFCNDYRHPVVLHKAAATIDVLSQGRLDFGIGAGFMASEYASAGMKYDTGGLRIDRMTEAVELILRLFGDEPVDHDGAHYQIRGLLGRPSPVQQPHPPIVIGGGGRRMLETAGRLGDIVGIHSNLSSGVAYDAGVIEDMLPDRMRAKVEWVHESAQAAGRDPDGLDLLYITWTSMIVESPAQVDAAWARVAERYGVDEAIARRSVGLLVGTAEQCHEQLLERRDKLGLNYVDFGSANAPMLGPLVEMINAGETPSNGENAAGR
jgi:probable F420-dependent oxidoreductase